MAIPKIYKYGIEITKPWSTEMYTFNESIGAYYQDIIIEAINNIKTTEKCNEIAKIVNPYGYGEGLDDDIAYMKSDMISNVENCAGYWIKDIVNELIEIEFIEGMVFESTPEMPELAHYDVGEVMNLIGFETRDEILKLRERFSVETL